MDRRFFLRLLAGVPVIGPMLVGQHAAAAPVPKLLKLKPYQSIVFATTPGGKTVAVVTLPGHDDAELRFHPSGDTVFFAAAGHLITPVRTSLYNDADFEDNQGHRFLSGDHKLVNAKLREYTGAGEFGPCSVVGITFDLKTTDLQNDGLIRTPAKFGHPESSAWEHIASIYRLIPLKS